MPAPSDPDLVAAAVARALDLRETGDQALVDLLVAWPLVTALVAAGG